jgi:hypothetical protein
MIIDLKYKRTANFLGRNGMFKQTGISVATTGAKSVTLQPFTSKGIIGRAWLEIPLEDVPSVIAALQKVTNLKSLLSTSDVASAQWSEAKSIIADAIEFGEEHVGGDESETLTSLKERAEKLNSI